MRLIDADALKKVLIERFTDEPDGYIERLDLHYWGPKIVMDVIENAPTIEPIRHGRWIEHGENLADRTCSVCGYAVWDKDAEEYSYCPNRGAKMDKEEA